MQYIESDDFIVKRIFCHIGAKGKLEKLAVGQRDIYSKVWMTTLLPFSQIFKTFGSSFGVGLKSSDAFVWIWSFTLWSHCTQTAMYLANLKS